MTPLYNPDTLLVIAGPCSLEDEALSLGVARHLQDLAQRRPQLQVFFKGSFDKANRTSLSSPRGPGLEAGLGILAAVKEATGLPVLTDIHEAAQAGPVAEVCDVLQIPAFLCRQTDLLLAAARTGRVVNVKKGQFLAAENMRFVAQKLEEGGARELWLTERGSCWGPGELVVDMRGFATLRSFGHPVVFDATHSVQQPGRGAGTTGGQRSAIPLLARAALAAGADGLFLETHPDLAHALSDGPNQVPLEALERVLEQALAVWQAARPWHTDTLD